jgi:hypothetical protein
MQTRQRTRRALTQQIQQHCQSFHLDVRIHKQKTNRYYKHKWRRTKTKYNKTKKRTTSWETQLYKYISNNIQKKVSKYHEVRDVMVHISTVPTYMWNRMMKHWENYTPQRKKSGYSEYKKTHQAAVFLATFPGTVLDKLVTAEQVMRITIGAKVAARALYDEKEHAMILSFYYEPYPFPPHWIPMFKTKVKVVGHCKHYLCFVDK